jgi:hypothetical protein
LTESWRRRWWHMPPPNQPNSNALAIMIDCFVAGVVPGWCGRSCAATAWDMRELGGDGGRGEQKLIAVALCSLPPGRQLYPTWWRLISIATMPAPSPLAAGQQVIAAGKGRGCSYGAILGGNHNRALMPAEEPQPQ